MIPSPFPRRLVLAIAAALALSGCKEALYSSLTEQEANEIVAVLSTANIEAVRERDKDNVYTVLVEQSAVPSATIELRQAGLPRASFQSMGDIFSASGIIGTPFEQHARYIHALNQEIAGMLTSIEGVDDAAVIVNVPVAENPRRDPPAATVAVTIHHEPDFPTADTLPKIKQLVSHSVPNLSYDNVSVAYFPRRTIVVERPAAQDATSPLQTVNQSLGLSFPASMSPRLTAAVLIGASALIALWSLFGNVGRRRPATRGTPDPTGRA